MRKREATQQKMQMELAEQDRGDNIDDEDRVKRRKFAPQQIRTQQRDRDAQPDEEIPLPPPRNDYVFKRNFYAPQSFDPRNDFLDSRMITDLQSVSLPFPV